MYARPVLCPSLIGRHEEMRLIDQAVASALKGRGGSMVLLGEAGIGKSRLAREAGARAEQAGLRVLWGHAVQDGQSSPYRPLAEALLSGLRNRPLPDAPTLRPFQPILGRLIPDWRRDEGATTDQSVVLLGEAILRLLFVLAGERGCLLILEDLHWADPETLSIVEYLSANLSSEHVLLVSTLRTGEPTPALRMVSSWHTHRMGQVLELQRLDDGETILMARACFGTADLPSPVSTALAALAEGLPLLVEDLLAEWRAGAELTTGGGEWREGVLTPVVPSTFAETVCRRLALLGEGTTALLQLAALLGRRFDWRVLREASGRDEEDVLDRLRGAVQAQLISSDSEHEEAAFRFRHALTQGAILDELLPPQRARLAARLLAVLQALYPDLPGEWCDLAARLAEEAGAKGQAAALLLELGRRALARGALTTAEATLGRAKAQCEAGSAPALAVEQLLLDTWVLAGKQEQVRAAGATLLAALARSNAPPERLCQVHILVARACVAASRWLEASKQLEAARQLSEAGAAGLLPSVDALAAHVALGQGQVDAAKELAVCARDGAEKAALWDVACEALEVLGRVARDRDLREAEAAFDQARRTAEEHGLRVWHLRAVHELGTIEMFTPGAGTDRLRQARELAESAGALGVAAMVDVQLAAAHMARGDFNAVQQLTSRSAAMAQRLHLDVTRAVALLFQAEGYARRGPDRSAMEATISAALEAAPLDPLFATEAQAWVWGDCRAIASLVEDNWPRALREIDQAQDFFRGLHGGAPSPALGLWALLQMLERGGEEGLHSCAEIATSWAMVHPINQAYLCYADAVRLGRDGRGDEATQAAARGNGLLAASSPWVMHLALRLVADEAIDHHWGDPARWMREAGTFFDNHGQPRLASACRALLRRCGVAPTRPARAHASVPPVFRVRGITTREMEVLAAISEGLSNREIAERLYVSPKTVEKHISHLLDKLDVRSRAHLAALFVAGTPPIAEG